MGNFPYSLTQSLTRSRICTTWNQIFQSVISSRHNKSHEVFDADEQSELKKLMLIDEENAGRAACISITPSNPNVEQNLHETIVANFPKLMQQEILSCRKH